MSSHYIGNHDDKAAEEAGAAVAQGAYLKTCARLTVFTFVPLAAGALAHGWITFCAISALGQLPTWASFLAGASLLAPVAFVITTTIQRRRPKVTATTPSLPSLAELNTSSDWLWRLTTAPIMPLSVIYLNHTGWPPCRRVHCSSRRLARARPRVAAESSRPSYAPPPRPSEATAAQEHT